MRNARIGGFSFAAPASAPALAPLVMTARAGRRGAPSRRDGAHRSHRPSATARAARADSDPRSPASSPGRLSIKEIAQEPGFSDMSSFSQAYARWTGVAPNVSRQETAGS
ncbi:hypothetical protein BCEP4_750039 [Burkholderia cepacia]|nr:hypothetical protein BCEP4_750039 [Burkholderia cepacia]